MPGLRLYDPREALLEDAFLNLCRDVQACTCVGTLPGTLLSHPCIFVDGATDTGRGIVGGALAMPSGDSRHGTFAGEIEGSMAAALLGWLQGLRLLRELHSTTASMPIVCFDQLAMGGWIFAQTPTNSAAGRANDQLLTLVRRRTATTLRETPFLALRVPSAMNRAHAIAIHPRKSPT